MGDRPCRPLLTNQMSESSRFAKHSLLNKVVDWARHEVPIRAVVLTGSLARGDGSTDQWSDLDAQIIATEFSSYIADDTWLDTLGEVWIRFPLYEDVPYRLVWFAGGVKVDFQFVSVDAIHDMIRSGALSDEYLRGYVVALDKDELFRDLPPSPHVFPQPDPPSAEQVQAVINEFYFEAIHVAQFIRRREYWVVKFRDWTMKRDLLQMLEWHARATRDEPVNTWLLGKRLHEWTEETTVTAAGQIWSNWEPAALWHSLLRQIELFRKLSSELTDKMGYEFQAPTYNKIEAYLRNLRDEDNCG